MKSIADDLPPDIAQQIHPDWRKNEAAYWAVRDQLLAQYQDQWIAFADGQVVASGRNSLSIFQAAQASDRHPFVTCVGIETGATRIRRDSFPYDTSYHSQALLDAVIPDTGADASVLPWSDCRSLQLDTTRGVPHYFTGVAGVFTSTVVFRLEAYPTWEPLSPSRRLRHPRSPAPILRDTP